jgi:hypothetical protein
MTCSSAALTSQSCAPHFVVLDYADLSRSPMRARFLEALSAARPLPESDIAAGGRVRFHESEVDISPPERRRHKDRLDNPAGDADLLEQRPASG